eukprot:629659-Rhodomonas_salina.4
MYGYALGPYCTAQADCLPGCCGALLAFCHLGAAEKKSKPEIAPQMRDRNSNTTINVTSFLLRVLAKTVMTLLLHGSIHRRIHFQSGVAQVPARSSGTAASSFSLAGADYAVSAPEITQRAHCLVKQNMPRCVITAPGMQYRERNAAPEPDITWETHRQIGNGTWKRPFDHMIAPET